LHEVAGLGLVQPEEGMASGAPNSNPSSDGRDGGDAAGLFTEVHGRRAETQEAQAGDKEKTFPHEDSSAVGLWPRQAGPYPALGSFMARLGEALSSLV